MVRGIASRSDDGVPSVGAHPIYTPSGVEAIQVLPWASAQQVVLAWAGTRPAKAGMTRDELPSLRLGIRALPGQGGGAGHTPADQRRPRAGTMKDNSIWRAVREGRAALGTGLKEFASRGVPWIIEASGFDYCMIDHEPRALKLRAGALVMTAHTLRIMMARCGKPNEQGWEQQHG